MNIPDLFFLDNKLYEKIKIINSEDVVVAFDYEEGNRVWLPRKHVRRNLERAYSVSATANMLNIRKSTLDKLINKQLVQSPAIRYNVDTLLVRGLYFPASSLYEIRDAVWEFIPKNKYGEPFRDTLVSEDDLTAKLHSSNENNFAIRDGEIIQVFTV